MVTVLWAAKGGSGTTVVAASLALRADRPSLLVDLDGELPLALGVAEPERPGIADWAASDAPPEHLADLLVELRPTTQLLPWRLGPRGAGSAEPFAGGRLRDALGWLTDWEAGRDGHVVIDAGTREPDQALAEAADRSLLVTRPCYLALTRAAAAAHTPTGIVVVREPGRSLRGSEIEHAVGAPIVAEVDWEPGIARAVDAGLLHARFPRVAHRALRKAAA